MGEGQSKVDSGLFNNSNPLIHRYLAAKPQVSPYREGMPAPKESILQLFLKRGALANTVRNPSGSLADSRKSVRAEPSNSQNLNRQETKNVTQTRFQEPVAESQPVQREPQYVEEYHPSYEQPLRKTPTQYYGGETSTTKMNAPEDRDTRPGSPSRDSPSNWAPKEKDIARYKEDRRKASDNLRYNEEGRWEKNTGGRYKTRKEEDPGFEYRCKGEERFTPAEIEILRENFDSFAKDNRINKYNLLKLLSLEDFEDNIIGSRIYSCIKQISSQGATFGNYVNYERYIQAMGILSRGDVQERLEFIYNVFDPNGEGYVTLEEMKNVIENLFRILRSTKFEHPTLNMLNDRISEIDEEELESLLEEIVREIFISFGKETGYLSFEEWKSWFMTQFGLFEVLNYKIKRIDV